MAEALYRKYRPHTFATVAEQEHVVKTISNQLAAGKVAHAYLFSGPRGVGKTTIARLLAKALNCEHRPTGSAEPCNECAACKDANSGRFLDTIEIDAASQTKVEETRENIIESIRFAPTRGKYKVFIIDEVHMLSTSSFNALLKTLEEPPAYVVFVLATTELHKIPATIISRCQRFDFHRIPADKVIERLDYIISHEGVTVDQEVKAAIARLSEGCLRDAESFLGQVLALGEKHISLETASLIIPATYIEVVTKLAEALAHKQAIEALGVVNAFVEAGGSIRHFTDEFIDYVRSMLFVALGGGHLDRYDAQAQAKLTATAAQLSAEDVQRLLDLLLSARGRSTPSQYPQLPLEIAIADFCLHAQPHSVLAPSQAKPMPRVQLQPSIAPPPLNLPELPAATNASAASSPLPEQTEVKGEESELMVASDADVDDIRNKWGRCVAWIGERNVALPLILNNGEILRADSGRVVIGFPYALHVEKMTEVKNQHLIEEAIAAVIQKRLGVTFIHNKIQTEEAVADLLEAFGGTVV